ncbi:DNA polymerase-3 subunit alpha [Faunimonas pinastri]|uniref:DNA polymerase III subunit alpha n=1 Tax=Faunimonas pinastri TaxID=1855383 RepID=A0A1H9MZF8_9HYPH|nr:DNA polymerase III subunit alpha [Faunimonas pinastri]SER28795.1 DNA polymerase-3 subunit alpha [Faunimonas pinastri]
MHSILAARTNFSIGESILTVEKLVDGAKALGAKAVAITDTMSVTGLIDFTNKAKAAEIKPIIGCRLRLVNDPSWRKTKEDKKAPPEFYLTWYVLSEKGLHALFRLLTLANSEERFYNNPKLSFADLFAALEDVTSDDVAIASSDAYSVLHHADALDILRKCVDALSARNVFLTLTPINAPYWDTLNKRAIAAAEALGCEFLTTRPASYLKEGADAAEIMNAVTRNVKITDGWHNSPFSRDLHPLSMSELAGECKGAITRLKARGVTDPGACFTQGLKNTARLADMVTYSWAKAPVSLPTMAPNEFLAVVNECKGGWAKRFGSSVFGHKPTAEELRDVYRPRLAYELEVLKKLSFSGYFLLVQDVVQFAKSNGILVGPGRGSVGGSLVAYLMGITDCDPIRFGLLFERFINPDRIDLPDADLDFMSERRHEVVEYLVEKYGSKRVAGVANFIALGPAAAIRDVSRVCGLSENDYRCSKLAPKEHGQSVKLKDSADQVAEIGQFRDRNPEIWDICLSVEGVTRTLGQHAAGIVVGGCDLVERAVIERRKGESVVCWDKRVVEDQGLVKMDILGLSTLDLINLTLKYIRERHGKRVDLMRIPLDDEAVLDNFAKGITTGIFQFESGGMRRLLRELGKDGTITFDDITAATALYRPGPMDSGMMDSYYLRKQGLETVEFDHPSITDALKDTYGVMVYQEEVMQVARDLAGYSMAEADKLRKIMGKKLPEEMAKQKDKFVEGCKATHGLGESQAGDIFEKISAFAGYGFNKSHSVEYTLISYQSMWLKTNYPVEFFAAALSLMNEEKLPGLLKDAERLGIEIVLPDLNLSTEQFEILTDTKLCIPFTRIKGLSENAAKAIVEARKSVGGKFASLEEFTAAVNKRLVHKGKMEVMDKVGVFARIVPGSLSARDPSRIKDQIEFIPGLIDAVVPVHRDMHTDRPTKVKIAELMAEYRSAHGPAAPSPGETDGMPVKITFGKQAKFVAITDAPTNGEERLGVMAFAESFGYTAEALSEAGLARADGYWTALIKRPKEGKQVSPEEIATYAPYLQRELDLLKPPVIVLLGSTVVRQFFPDFKGKASDAAGKIVYSEQFDANVVIGFNPGEIYHDRDKQLALNEVFAKVADLIA